MNSRLCQGWVSHRRWAPRPHAFRYPIGMMYLDLDEQAQPASLSPLFKASRFAPLCWRPSDYLPAWTRHGQGLKEAVRTVLGKVLDDVPQGAVYLLTQPRSWGLSFNPVSFYFCHDDDGRLAAILLEVRNTPWRERFHYVLPVQPNTPGEFVVAKAFHVSPFLPADMHYRMRFSIQAEHLRIHMENHRDGQKVFEADLALRCQALTAKTLRQHLLAFPWMSLRTVSAIYWQALRLLLKRTPLHDHYPSQGEPRLGRHLIEESEHAEHHPGRE